MTKETAIKLLAFVKGVPALVAEYAPIPHSRMIGSRHCGGPHGYSPVWVEEEWETTYSLKIPPPPGAEDFYRIGVSPPGLPYLDGVIASIQAGPDVLTDKQAGYIQHLYDNACGWAPGWRPVRDSSPWPNPKIKGKTWQEFTVAGRPYALWGWTGPYEGQIQMSDAPPPQVVTHEGQKRY